MISLGSIIAPTKQERQGYGPEARALDSTAGIWAQGILNQHGLQGRCATGSDYDTFCLAAARAEAIKRIAQVQNAPDNNGPFPIYGDWQTVVILAREVSAKLGLEGTNFDAAPYGPGEVFGLQTARVSVFADVNAGGPEGWERTYTVMADEQGRPIVPPTLQQQIAAIAECERLLQARGAIQWGPGGFQPSDLEAARAAYRDCVDPLFRGLPPSGTYISDAAVDAAREEWQRREPVEVTPERETRDTPGDEPTGGAGGVPEGREAPPEVVVYQTTAPAPATPKRTPWLLWGLLAAGAFVVYRVSRRRRK